MLHLFFDGDIRREGKSMEKNSGVKLVAQNKKAYHDYFVLEKLEAGIELFGTEVKSIREGRINLKDSWCFVKDGEMLANGVHISPYEHGNIFNRDPLRTKRLLLHKKEIRRLGCMTRCWDYKGHMASEVTRSAMSVGLGRKIYPNEPCPCGSGKKYKRCCGRKG